MMKIIIGVLCVFLTVGCGVRHAHVGNVGGYGDAGHFKKASLKYEERLAEDRVRIDTLLKGLMESGVEVCHYHGEYDGDRDYEVGHNVLLEELVFLHDISLENEKYIFQRVMRDREMRRRQRDVYNCILLFRKRDCDEEDIDHRMNALPHMLRDTGNVLKSIELIKHIEVVLNEPCERTQRHIRSEVEWRRQLFEGLKAQIPLVRRYNADETEDVEYIYYAMAELPDSLTTNFAYEYLMQDSLSKVYNDLPWAIFDILEHSVMYEKEYSHIAGPQIHLTDEKIDRLKARLEVLDMEGDCDWCGDTMGMLEKIRGINGRKEIR